MRLRSFLPGRRSGVDYFGTSLHKWMMAPAGTGMLFMRRERIPQVWPLNPAPAALRENIRKFEATGVSRFAIRSAITDAVDFHESVAWIARRRGSVTCGNTGCGAWPDSRVSNC